MSHNSTVKNTNSFLSRRSMIVGGTSSVGLLLAGCSSSSKTKGVKKFSGLKKKSSKATFQALYGARPNEKFPIPALPKDSLDPRFFRQRVNYKTKEKPGTVIVDTSKFYLYLVEPKGKAMRYGVGLGKAGFEWSGRGRILWKQVWPKWTPPAEMIERRPELEKWSEENGGMPGGLDNPLGARALYIFQGNEDTLYRLHGSPEHHSIGKAVSSGCVRLVHQDVIDLYDRVKTRSKILVV